MIDKLKRLMEKKSFHVVITISIIVVIIFVVGMIILKYQVEGETNMPFDLDKIVLISSSEGTDKEAGENKWAFDIDQNNDVYVYVEKNKNYTKQEAIQSIVIDNIEVQKEKEVGEVCFYRPNLTEAGGTFRNIPENVANSIDYKGDMESDLKNLKISNQGGILAFRYANERIAEYKSNDEEINHSKLLKMTGVSEDDLKSQMTFDMTIKLQSGKEYKANISLEFPVKGVVEKGTSSYEMTNMKNIIFKRIKN